MENYHYCYAMSEQTEAGQGGKMLWERKQLLVSVSLEGIVSHPHQKEACVSLPQSLLTGKVAMRLSKTGVFSEARCGCKVDACCH